MCDRFRGSMLRDILMVKCRCAADVGIGSLGKKNTTYAVSSYSLLEPIIVLRCWIFPHTVIVISCSPVRQHVQLLASVAISQGVTQA